MKQILSLFALAVAVFVAGCGNSDDNGGPATTELTLLATGTYGDDPLVMFERTYEYEDNMALQMQLLQTYLSDIALVYEEDGVEKEELLTDIALVSFGNVFTDEDAAEGVEVVKMEVPVRNYTGLKIGLGVSPELNATIPPDYDLTHPLSQNYWEDASSYIFFKVEGNADLDADGQFQDKLTYHVGGDNNYSTVQFTGAIDLEKGTPKTLALNIDLQKILIKGDGTYWDFREGQFAHSTTSPAAVFMGENFPNAVRLETR
ncbi:MbnP family protein [Phaeodactylibacter xiamenensis]|uniref:MbnP family protein n=1 Tax=Phaeodactylibacter xiamenensis TaxID=1524460 RepID=UPI003BABE170